MYLKLTRYQNSILQAFEVKIMQSKVNKRTIEGKYPSSAIRQKLTHYCHIISYRVTKGTILQNDLKIHFILSKKIFKVFHFTHIRQRKPRPLVAVAMAMFLTNQHGLKKTDRGSPKEYFQQSHLKIVFIPLEEKIFKVFTIAIY